MSQERKLVVLTPVKNESWILSLFCASTSLWADHIIIADQKSTDNSKEIASKFPKVTLIDNESEDLDEGYRDKILVEKARDIVGNNGILFRIDADEIFTPKFDSDDWKQIRQSKSGTIFCFRWIQLNKDLSSYWETKGSTMYGAFVDDGREFSPHGLIHARYMFKPDSPNDVIIPQDIGLLHFQFADWNRMCSKHRWYQCFEKIKFPDKSAIDIYRMYHWMYNPSLPYQGIPSEWINTYQNSYGIDITNYIKDENYWWDDKVREYLLEYSPKYFKHIETYRSLQELMFAKGKNFLDKLLLLYLHCTKSVYNTKQGFIYKTIVKIDSFLKFRMGI